MPHSEALVPEPLREPPLHAMIAALALAFLELIEWNGRRTFVGLFPLYVWGALHLSQNAACAEITSPQLTQYTLGMINGGASYFFSTLSGCGALHLSQNFA
jgi:hypothetical protein